MLAALGTVCAVVIAVLGGLLRRPRKRREAEARTPAAKIAAAAARPPRREQHPADPVGFERPRPRAQTHSYQQRREAVWMTEPARSLLVTAIGQRSFDPLDSEEIEHCLRWLDGQPRARGHPRRHDPRGTRLRRARRTILAPSRTAQALVSARAFS